MAREDLENDHGLLEDRRPKTKKPDKYKVILHNDDYTSMEFVIEVLMGVFYKTESEAMTLMLEVHNKGKSVVGLYPYEIAETKIAQVEDLAKSNGFPLKASMEKE